ncbi:hypothetical protein [Mobilicoccus pelagius]|uniref:Secreted protein n=1 Tax=Mobilicoccus pelagius NBRC 104925 TaxID=1089455 RepID=H5UW82_9MICO|nr:hypothetical protein [Mobilicoccus pelagius]GAB49990.1 hypothetical protein MOPEL_136_00030 [Mobilicoccus pelagius NBRC 104925]
MTKKLRTVTLAMATSLLVLVPSALSSAASPGDDDEHYSVNGSQVTLHFASDNGGAPRAPSERSSGRKVSSITIVTPGDSSATAERTVSTFEQPVDEKTARKLANEGSKPANPTKDEISRGLEAARQAALAGAASSPQSAQPPDSSPQPDAATPMAAAASDAIFLACSKGEGYRSTPSGTMYLSIYCGHTNPRIGFAFMLNQKMVATSMGDAEDTGMRWTYNGRAKPTLAWKTWKAKGGYLTGTFAPIAVDSEVTYGDSLYYRLLTAEGTFRVFHTDIGGVIYPV